MKHTNDDVDGEVEYKFMLLVPMQCNGDDDNSYHMLVVGGRPPD